MGYVDTEFARSGKRIFGEVRGKRVALRVSELPFVPHHYQRN
jgi:aminomethyltransferase